MFSVEELRDEMLVNEGHYLEKIQNEALEEGYLHHTISEFEDLIKEYGVGFVVQKLSEQTKSSIFECLAGYNPMVV